MSSVSAPVVVGAINMDGSLEVTQERTMAEALEGFSISDIAAFLES